MFMVIWLGNYYILIPLDFMQYNRIINNIDNTSDYSSSHISRMPANKMHF